MRILEIVPFRFHQFNRLPFYFLFESKHSFGNWMWARAQTRARTRIGCPATVKWSGDCVVVGSTEWPLEWQTMRNVSKTFGFLHSLMHSTHSLEAINRQSWISCGNIFRIGQRRQRLLSEMSAKLQTWPSSCIVDPMFSRMIKQIAWCPVLLCHFTWEYFNRWLLCSFTWSIFPNNCKHLSLRTIQQDCPQLEGGSFVMKFSVNFHQWAHFRSRTLSMELLVYEFWDASCVLLLVFASFWPYRIRCGPCGNEIFISFSETTSFQSWLETEPGSFIPKCFACHLPALLMSSPARMDIVVNSEWIFVTF